MQLKCSPTEEWKWKSRYNGRDTLQRMEDICTLTPKGIVIKQTKQMYSMIPNLFEEEIKFYVI